MPTINIYSANPDAFERFDAAATKDLRTFIAERLSCGDIALSADEVSVRLVTVHPASRMMGDVEADIHAHEFSERMDRQDELCREIAMYLRDDLQLASEPRVWLVLSQLGHSV